MEDVQQENTEPLGSVDSPVQGPQPVQPPGAFTAFLGLAGAGYVVMLLFVFAFGLWGDALTAGVDSACAEAAFQSGKQVEARGNYDLAIQRYRQALEGRFPDKAREYECARSIGEVLVRLGRYEDAVAAYRALAPEVLSLPGHFTAYVSALFNAGHNEEAERVGKQWLERAEAANDQQQLLWANTILGRICERLNRPEDALKYCQAAAAIDPEGDANIFEAKVLQKLGRTPEAIRQLDAFLTRAKPGQLREDAVELRTRLQAQPAQ